MGLFKLSRRNGFFSILLAAGIVGVVVWTCQKDDLAPGPPTNTTPVQPTPTNINTEPGPAPSVLPSPGGIPHPDHIIFCFFENKGYTQIIDNYSEAPYINSLRMQGALFTNSYALGHPSYPEYIRFFAGTPNGVTTDDCINTSDWTIPNLYTQLAAVGKTFAWYSEGLPEVGSKVCTAGRYAEKHNPTTLFANVPASANKPFSAFPADYSTLESVVCISPDLGDDMHDGTIAQGDNWLHKLSGLIDWCKTHNSIFVVYWDEDNGQFDNRIPVIAVGQPVKANFHATARYDHYNWTRTACSMFNVSPSWSGNLMSRTDIVDCWK